MSSSRTVSSSLPHESHSPVQASPSHISERKDQYMRLEVPQFTATALQKSLEIFRQARSLSLIKLHGSSSVQPTEIEAILKAEGLSPLSISFQRGRIQLIESVVGQADGSIFKALFFLILSRDGQETAYRFYCIRGEQAKLDFRQAEIAKWIKRDQQAL